MISKRIIETVREQYVSGLYNMSSLVDRWVPEITVLDLEDILSYRIGEDIKKELKKPIKEMGEVQDKVLKALKNQTILANDLVVTKEDTMPINTYWDSVFTELQIDYKWLTKSVFKKIKNLN